MLTDLSSGCLIRTRFIFELPNHRRPSACVIVTLVIVLGLRRNRERVFIRESVLPPTFYGTPRNVFLRSGI